MNEPVFPPLGTPGHHDRRSPPGSPAGLPIKWVSAPWHCAPASQRVCLCQEHQLNGSIGPSRTPLEPRFVRRRARGAGIAGPSLRTALYFETAVSALVVYGKALPPTAAESAASAVQFAWLALVVTPPNVVPETLERSRM